MAGELEKGFLLDSVTPPTDAILMVVRQVEYLLKEILENRETSSLWNWNQLVSEISSYVRDSKDFVLSELELMGALGPTEVEILHWLGGGSGLAHLATLDDFQARLAHILGQTLDSSGEPFNGDVYAALLSEGDLLIARQSQAKLQGRLEKGSFATQVSERQAQVKPMRREHLQSNWPKILDTLAARSRSSWAVAFTTRFVDFEDGLVTLEFPTNKDFHFFKQAASAAHDLRNAIREVSGVTVKFRGRVAYEGPEASCEGLDSAESALEAPSSSDIKATDGAKNNFRLKGFTKTDSIVGNRVVDESGRIIDKSLDEESWLRARKLGITASDANRLIKLNGEKRTSFWSILPSKDADFESPYFNSYALGIEREPEIAKRIKEEFSAQQFVVNHWLFESSEWSRHLATPDLVGPISICEIKVGSKPLRQLEPRYRDQLQWQMHVLNCEKVLFAVEQRFSKQIETKWVDRDQRRIDQLVEAAEEILSKM